VVAAPSAEVGLPAEELAIVTRLREGGNAPAEWRREALLCHADFRSDECGQILEAACQVEQATQFSMERTLTMQMLAGHCISRATSPPYLTLAERKQLLAKANSLVEQAEQINMAGGAAANVESFLIKGFLALASHTICQSNEDELKRAEVLFNAALRIDSSSPRAHVGKAIVFAHANEWGKALSTFRQVFKWAAPWAPRAGLRFRRLNQMRFAVAVCFCSLGRFEPTRQALASVIAADPRDVECLCALAHLEAKVSKDGVGKSMEYLGEAASIDRNHPVVLCHLANHAFYCGFEGAAAENGRSDAPAQWELANSLLWRALGSARSEQVKAEVHYQLARLEHARGRYAEACSYYERCYRAQPSHLACAMGLAQTYVQMQRYTEAIPLLETLQQGKAPLPEGLKLLAFAYLMVGGKAKEAMKCTDTLVAKNKDDVDAWAMRAEANDQLSALEVSAPTAPKLGVEAYEHVARLLEDTARGHGAASPELWNNLGTLRGLQGDSDGAREAYSRGLALADELLVGERGSSAEGFKDLQVAQLTMRFNRAWLAESTGEQPDFGTAAQDYMSICEENNWYADTLLRLGAQWQRVGESEMALQRYHQAMKHNPVLAALMQAELHRHQADYSKALQSAETAVRCAGEKQFHYAHVFLGNLYHEVASSSATKQSDRDVYLKKALWNFTRALEHQKDSHYAANGIGMVFAQRGKLDFAKRTFQSVVQHHSMAGDPAVFVNLAHTYLRSGGDDNRKAIALYQRALKMRPDDITIRLYLAKAHFSVRDWDRCLAVLADATQIWPDDLLLRYNLAVTLESAGVYLVAMEKKTKRVVGVDSGMDQMTRAVELLSSAARVYAYVHLQWAEMSERERKRLANTTGAPSNLLEEMKRVALHKDYCADITDRAKEELNHLINLRKDMDDRMHRINAEKEERERVQREAKAEGRKKDEERRLEMEEQALHMMEATREIHLGQNLGEQKDALPKKPPQDKALKLSKTKEKEKQLLAVQGKGDLAEQEPGADMSGDANVSGAMIPAGLGDGAIAGEDEQAGQDSPHREKSKKDKKDKKKKDKKDKKDKKLKKALKRAREEEEVDGEQGDDFGIEALEEEEYLPIAEEPDAADTADARKSDKKDKKDKKKKKKDKDKKDKKAKKQRRAGGSDSGEGDVSPQVAPRTEEDIAMEEDLFGPDDE